MHLISGLVCILHKGHKIHLDSCACQDQYREKRKNKKTRLSVKNIFLSGAIFRETAYTVEGRKLTGREEADFVLTSNTYWVLIIEPINLKPTFSNSSNFDIFGTSLSRSKWVFDLAYNKHKQCSLWVHETIHTKLLIRGNKQYQCELSPCLPFWWEA